MTNIRKIEKQDLNDLKQVIQSSELFPSEMLDEMSSSYFETPHSSEIWLTKEIDQKPIAIAYCAPERMTSGTYNLLLIAIHKSYQGKGIGNEIMNYIEDLLKKQFARILIVETSSLPEFELTRKFYDKCGYNREAIIRDFYNEGEDKIVFWKKLFNE